MAKEQRLIDANVLDEAIRTDFWEHFTQCHDTDQVALIDMVCEDIGNAPTVDAAEVVHAEWLDIRFDSMWRSMLATCSHCKVRGEVRVKSNECGFAVPDSDYCPHCGAKMDGGV